MASRTCWYYTWRMPDQPQPKQINFTIVPDDSPEVPRTYSNFCSIAHTPFDFTLTFCEVMPLSDKEIKDAEHEHVEVQAGIGFGLIPAHVVRRDVKEGRLRHVCPGWFHRRLSLHALLPTRQAPPRVRAFLTAIKTAAKPFGFAEE